MSELVDVYDRDRRPTGKIVERGEKFFPDEYRLIVHVCIFNSRGELLIAQRSPDKRSYGGYWDVSAGGHSIAGENSAQAIERELFEELGLRRSFFGRDPALTVFFKGGFDDYYLLLEDLDVRELRVDSVEVGGVRWASLEDINEMLISGEFVPYRKAFPALLFQLNAAGGNILGE